MNRKEAIEYNENLKKKLEQAASQYGLDKSIGTYIIDNCITIVPENPMRNMILLGESSASYKAGNIKIDFKKALIAGLELMASISMPENIFNYIQLLIISIFFIEESTKLELSRLEAYIVYLLHKNNAYNTEGIKQERFIRDLQKLYKQKEKKVVERKEVINAINTLHKIKATDFNEDNIYLKEHVWGEIK